MPTITITNCSNCGCSPCTCHHDECDSCAPTVDNCTPDTGCPITLDFECVIYNKYGKNASALTTLNIANGTDGKTILEAIDTAFGNLTSFAFPTYTTNCLNFDGYVIDTQLKFLQAVDDEICTIRTSFGTLTFNLTTQVNDLTDLVDDFNHPAVTADACGLGILVTDTISQVLTKLKDGYCLLSNNTFADTSPVFAPVNSTSIGWITGGTKNHAPSASVRKSAFGGNQLQILADGLYVGDILPTTQVLSYDAILRTISLSNGGGSVVLPDDEDNQTLSLDTFTNELSISGGNTVDLTPIIPAFTQTSITPTNTNSITITATGTANTDVQADVNISVDAGNQVSIHSDGLFVPEVVIPIDPDEKVKASGAGTEGYLIDKINPVDTDTVDLTISYNVGTDQLDIQADVDIADILTEIDGDGTLTTQLNAIITHPAQVAQCSRFKIVNSDGGGSHDYNYIDCSDVIFNGNTLGASSDITILARGVFSADDEILIYNLGINF